MPNVPDLIRVTINRIPGHWSQHPCCCNACGHFAASREYSSAWRIKWPRLDTGFGLDEANRPTPSGGLEQAVPVVARVGLVAGVVDQGADLFGV
jgi:hypothetical protein